MPHIFPSPDQHLDIVQPEEVRAGRTLQVGHLAELGHTVLGVATDSDPRIAEREFTISLARDLGVVWPFEQITVEWPKAAAVALGQQGH